MAHHMKVAIALVAGTLIAWTAIATNNLRIVAWADRTTLRIGKWAGLED